MNPRIEEIIRLSGTMPDVQRHRRYLETLSEAELETRAHELRCGQRPDQAPVRFWRPKRAVNFVSQPQPADEAITKGTE